MPVFISYSHDDAQFVDNLAAQLRAESSSSMGRPVGAPRWRLAPPSDRGGDHRCERSDSRAVSVVGGV